MTIKNSLFTILLAPLALFLFAGCTGEADSSAEAETNAEESNIEVLFNGEDLTGWSGKPENWSVVDGVIVGETNDENPLPYNQFLIWEGDPVEDFVLTAELKLTSNGNNSGIQYRAQARPDLGEQVVSGYQCDMHAAVWANGMLYDEKGRGILCKRGQKVVITPEGKAKIVGELPAEPEFNPAEWTTYKVTAKGNHLVHEVNGVQTADVYDHDEENRDLGGIIAFQIHRGPTMKIEIRNVTLERLETSDVTPFSETPVPADAADVNPPKPAAKGKGKKAKAKGEGKAKGPGKNKAKGEGPGKAKPKTQ